MKHSSLHRIIVLSGLNSLLLAQCNYYQTDLGTTTCLKLIIWLTPVVNAMKVLQACIYKSIKTGLFSKPFVATSGVYFKIIMLFC